MLENFIKNYYSFFDEQLRSSTVVVLFVVLLIFTAGSVNAMNSHYMKSSLLDAKENISPKATINTIVIDGVKYEIIFSRIN